MPQRIIVQGQTTTQQMQNTQFELSKMYLSVGTSVKTLAATARGVVGVQQLAARADHVHPMDMAPAGAIAPVSFSTSSAGVSGYFPRADHMHRIPLELTTQACNVMWSTSTAGVSSSVARGDHVHLLKPGAMTMPVRGTSQTYTNNGSGPMFIGISLSLSLPAADGAHLQIDGVDVAHGDGPADIHFFLLGIANPGQQYLLTATGGVNIGHWYEYRF